MSEQTEYLIFAIFDDEKTAGVAASAIKDAAKEESVDIEGLAAVHRDTHGRVHIHETGDITGSQGAVRGAIVGGLIGVIFPPAVLGSSVVGAAVAGMVAKFHDKGFKTGDLHHIGEKLGKGQSAVFFVGDQSSSTAFDAQLGGASITEQPMTPELKYQMAEFQGVV